jgi:hypothetical protein
LSLLSKTILIHRNKFNAFQERPGQYPTDGTALPDIDLIKIANERGLFDIGNQYSCRLKARLTFCFYPLSVEKLLPRAFSYNLLFVARTPARNGV